jgi:septal ring factor EnvC (AmiA/AmiB activator)
MAMIRPWVYTMLMHLPTFPLPFVRRSLHCRILIIQGLAEDARWTGKHGLPRLTARATLCLLLLSVAFGAATADVGKPRTLADVEQQIEETSARLQSLDEEIASSKALKSELQQALQAAQGRVGEREERLRDLDRQIIRFDAKLDTLQGLAEEATDTMAFRQQSLAQALRSAQAISRQSTLKIVLQHDDPALADRLAVYTGYVLAAQNASIESQAATLKRIEAARSTALKDRNWLNYIKNKAALQKQDYAGAAAEKQRSLGKVEAVLDSKTRTVAELNADQQRLQSLMDELRNLQNAESGYFSSGKGRYPAPVTGEIIARFGDVKAVGKLRWKGLFIKASEGQTVHAVADGEVVYSDFLQGFGMLVIIDHGDGYTSLYGGNRDVTVPRGQWVESGAGIATVGDSGGQTASGVYFEIRQAAKAVNPEEWLSPDLQVARRQ